MKKSEVTAKSRHLRKKEAEKLASLAETAQPNTELPNADREFVSRLYLAKRTFLVRVPRSTVESLGLHPGGLVRLKIQEEGEQ
ncbi:MAG: hypothetical protein ABC527_06665 [Candidatus Methanosuratincola petrocarbonis]